MTNKVAQSSVQKVDTRNYWTNTIFRLASQYDIIPEWWSPSRDAWFRKYWYQENFLASAIYAISNRNAAFGWQLTGKQSDVEYGQQLLQFADFSGGWQNFIIKLSQDLLVQDNGGFVEIIREARVKLNGQVLKATKEYNEQAIPEWYTYHNHKRIKLDAKQVYNTPMDRVIGIAHLDAGNCVRTGDADTPVIYTDREGKKHALKFWQVIPFNEMPSPIQKMNGVGTCALSRVFRASHIMQSMSLYNDEKLSGRFNRAVFLTNVDADIINDTELSVNQ